MGILERIASRLAADPERIRAQEVRGYCSAMDEVQQIAESRARIKARVVGIVQSIKVIPGRDYSMFEIEINDGTDQVVGIWYGRREIPGITLGRPVIFEGTMIKSGERRTPYMVNPAYHLVGAEAL